jgi:hypothetical protein
MTSADYMRPPSRPAGSARSHSPRWWIRAPIAALAICFLLGAGIAMSPRAAAQEGETPASCRVGVDVLTIHSFNTGANTFDAGFWIWSVCPDDRVKPLTAVEFVNANRVALSLEGATVVDGVVWSYARVEGTFRYFWDLTNFPFDRHTLEIRIESSELDASAFVFVADTGGSAFEPDMPLAGWDVASFNVGSSISTYETTYGDPRIPEGTSDYSRFTVGIGLERDDFSSFVKLTFVVYMAFLLSLVSYFINLETPTMLAARLGVISGALFAVAVNLHTVSSTLGSQEGLTLLGRIHVATMAAILTGAVGALGAQMLVERGRSEAALKRFDRNAMLTVMVAYVLINVWLIGSVALKY